MFLYESESEKSFECVCHTANACDLTGLSHIYNTLQDQAKGISIEEESSYPDSRSPRGIGAVLPVHTVRRSAQHATGVDSICTSFTEAVSSASANLPRAPMRQESDWVTDAVSNLSQKDAWISLCNNRTSSSVEEYKHLFKMTKLAADQARNA